MNFLEFLNQKGYFDLLPNRASESIATTVAALKYKQGVVIGCDGQATQIKNLDKFPEPVKKVFAVENHSALGIAGAPNIALEIVRIFKTTLSAEQRISGFLSAEGKVSVLRRIVGKYFPLVLQTEGKLAAEFIFVTFDGQGRVFSCDPSAFSIEQRNFTTIGSGGSHALHKIESGWTRNLTEEKALKLLFASLKYAESKNAATGPPYFFLVVNKKGVREVSLKEVKDG